MLISIVRVVGLPINKPTQISVTQSDFGVSFIWYSYHISSPR